MQKKPLFIMLGLFIAPILVAKIVLVNNWYQGAKTNAGELITPPLSLSLAPQAWLLLYNPTDNCSAICQESIWQIQQVHTLLASEGDRVQRYLTALPSLQSERIDTQALTKLQLSATNQQQLSSDTLYLVDPLGNIFMRYQFTADKTAAMKVSAGLLKDLKRLLKISKIG
ncbi:hypothetical protein FR932_01440 [Moritella marina ATCC 15381]|uniref:Transmembrane cytochrome oxidase associated protein n=1 Tax=Moritella marina ATCC 15381 TaxID=1202962 RepID=A0A5J6WF61_MORMI|nr:hypothetical protein [Moritella marina]QFI36587.1 hypothetical protein FR932_01440 [Moritella marina ATCC 15381]